MSFKPRAGHWSINTFSDASGSFEDTSLQNIVNGYVSLIPQNDSEFTYISAWHPFTGWSVVNGLESRSVITGTFLITGGIEFAAGTYSGATLYQRSVASAGAWEIFTDYPTVTGLENSVNTQFACLVSTSGTAYSGWFNYFSNGGTHASIEFDVASLFDPYSGNQYIPGFNAMATQLTGLTALQGQVGHGVFLSNGVYCDMLEILPYGIRSVTHPELAIPIDLSVPKRFRIGLSNQDIYIQCEDGKSIVGLSKFDTSVTDGSPAGIVIGAPIVTGTRVPAVSNVNVFSSVGHTYWGSFKIVTGQLITQVLSGIEQAYPMNDVTMYTDVFDPSIPISQYISASVRYLPSFGGTTTISAQYSGISGFVDVNSTTITPSTSNPFQLDLTDIPIRTYPYNDLTNRYISNPVRFKVTQSSADGRFPPPAIDSIQLMAAKGSSFLDIHPSWKPIDVPTKVELNVRNNDFLFADPEADVWTSLLINVTSATGEVSLIDSSLSANEVIIYGTGEINSGGRYGKAFCNYKLQSATAISGSSAESIFGQVPVYNVFPDPLFDVFKTVNIDPHYVTGFNFGELGEYMSIPTTYTGGVPITYTATPIYRPVTAGFNNRMYNVLGLSINPTNDHMQSVLVHAITSGTHNGSAGIEAIIPSGIAVGNLVASLDLNIPQGDEIAIFVSGSATQASWTVNGNDFRVSREISVPIYNAATGEIRFGLVVPSGKNATSAYEYSIDNLIVTPINQSYISITGMSIPLHQSGIIDDKIVVGTYPPYRACTVFNADIYLDSYPLTTGILFKTSDSNQQGVTLYVNSAGKLGVTTNLAHKAVAANSASQPFYQSLGTYNFESTTRIPVGRWINVGYIHQAATYDKLCTVNYSGALVPTLFASTNRSYLTLDGYPIQSVDMESGWYHRNTIDTSLDSTPLLTYIPMSGNVSVTLMSGLYGRMDAVKFDRPPVADAEIELSIKGARAAMPYFAPEYFYNGKVSSDVANNLVDDAWLDNYGYDTYIGSCYNFASPGYTHWDHGPWRNHLIFSGSIIKEETSPYSGLGSTRFTSGSYGVATYSSATERLMNSAGNLELDTLYTVVDHNRGRITVQGWLYPRSTGRIFSILDTISNFTGARVELSLSPSNLLEITRHTTSGTTAFKLTGTTSKELNAWHYIGFDYLPGTGRYTTNTSDVVAVTLFNDESFEILESFSGLNCAFRYGGHTGDTISSAMVFGYGIDANYCDWAITVPKNNEYMLPTSATGFKGGRYQALMKNSSLYTGDVNWTGYYSAYCNLPTTSHVSSDMYWVAAMNAYDNNAKLNGGVLLHDDQLFEEVESYRISYDTSIVDNAFGATNSAIRIGPSVPEHAINIARINSIEFTSDASITTIDLSDRNVNNLTDYKGGLYSINRNNGSISPSVISGDFNGINSGQYSGRADVVFSNAVYSTNVEISTVPISNINLTEPSEAYYYYLIGRGSKSVRIENALPHYYSGVSEFTTGSSINNYITNLSKIKNSIKLTYSDGSLVPFDSYPYDIIASPYSPESLYESVANGEDLFLGPIYNSGTETLPDGVFSVILLSNKKYIPQQTVWVNYPSYNHLTEKIDMNTKEVLNPLPIYRSNESFEVAIPGRYKILQNSGSSTYDLIFYGLESYLSGSI